VIEDHATSRTAPIGNADTLLDHGPRRARAVAVAVAAAGLAACDPGAAVEREVVVEPDGIRIAGVAYPLATDARVVVLGAGKATLTLAAGLERVLGDRLRGGLVVVRSGEEGPLDRIDVLTADHPLPSVHSAAAAEAMVARARAVDPADLVIGCFTGGSSALVSLPPDGVTVEDKRELHRLLLAGGLPITAVNTVRKHVSAIKGGRLVAALGGARLVNLTVSDVAGDHLDAITDPTVVDTTTPADAERVLRDAELWDAVPASVRAHLATPAAASPAFAAEIPTVLLATGRTACDAMAASATEHGYRPVVISTSLEGEAADVGGVLGALARESFERGGVGGAPFSPPCVLIGCGGESTVTLRDGRFGEGGPNQEAALGFARTVAPAAGVAAVFLDTDGSDGGTALAGALVDGTTAARAAERGLDLGAALRTHRAGEPLRTLGDAVVTGPTGTNVNDLFAVVVEAPGDQA
jgi:glycerate-2-kinase